MTPTDLAAELAAQPSATAVLQHHCDRLSGGKQKIRAVTEPTDQAPAPLDLTTRLKLTPDQRDTIGLRHVSLRCGDIPLSDAWNWYVPARLTASMNTTLTTTRTPFGRAVAALHFTRESLPEITTGLPDHVVLRNRAVLIRATDSAPVAYVQENYLPASLD